MNPRFTIALLVSWSCTMVHGQQDHFIDRLFDSIDTQMEQIDQELYAAQAEMLKQDMGIGFGFSATNGFNTEQQTNGRSMRVTSQIDLLDGGFKENRMRARELEMRAILDYQERSKESIGHHYGILYDHIISQFCVEKLSVIDELILKLTTLDSLNHGWYHQKQIEYSEILSTRAELNEMRTYRNSLDAFIRAYQLMTTGLKFPPKNDLKITDLDIEGLSCIQTNANHNSLSTILQMELIESENKRSRMPDLRVSAGYDLYLKRPYYGLRLSKALSPSNKQVQRLQIEKTLKEQELLDRSVLKELLSLSYELDSKKKAYHDVQRKLSMSSEEIRLLRNKRVIEQLEESKLEKELKIQHLQLELERTDIEQIWALRLLAIRKQIHPMSISSFLEPIDELSEHSKLPGKRYMMLNEPIGTVDSLLIEENSFILIEAKDSSLVRTLSPIDPDDFNTRIELERYLTEVHGANTSTNFLFNSLKAFYRLEKRSRIRASVMTNSEKI